MSSTRCDRDTVECRGVAIPEGTKVMLLYGSADHDEAVFDDTRALRLDCDLARLRRQRLAFGAGVNSAWAHHWPGWRVASRLRRSYAECRRRRLAGEPGRIEPFLLCGQRPMPVRW